MLYYAPRKRHLSFALTVLMSVALLRQKLFPAISSLTVSITMLPNMVWFPAGAGLAPSTIYSVMLQGQDQSNRTAIHVGQNKTDATWLAAQFGPLPFSSSKVAYTTIYVEGLFRNHLDSGRFVCDICAAPTTKKHGTFFGMTPVPSLQVHLHHLHVYNHKLGEFSPAVAFALVDTVASVKNSDFCMHQRIPRGYGIWMDSSHPLSFDTMLGQPHRGSAPDGDDYLVLGFQTVSQAKKLGRIHLSIWGSDRNGPDLMGLFIPPVNMWSVLWYAVEMTFSGESLWAGLHYHDHGHNIAYVFWASPKQLRLPPIGGNCTVPLRVDSPETFFARVISQAGCNFIGDCASIWCYPQPTDVSRSLSSVQCKQAFFSKGSVMTVIMANEAHLVYYQHMVFIAIVTGPHVTFSPRIGGKHAPLAARIAVLSQPVCRATAYYEENCSSLRVQTGCLQKL